MVATGEEMKREKNSSRSGKSQGISLLVRKNLYLWNKSGENEILRVHAYQFFSLCFSCFLTFKVL